MVNSRSLNDLLPAVRSRVMAFIAECEAQGIELLVTSTYRDLESQTALYALGRTAPGQIVTQAKAGQSFHNYRCAVDVVPMRNGQLVWSTSGADGLLWAQVGAIGKSCGLDWAGDWTTFKEMCHFQYTGGLDLAQLQAGSAIV